MICVIGGTLHQWDVDRKIKVLNKNIVRVAFSNNHYYDCERFTVVDGVVTIPNKFLKSHQDMSVYGIDANGKEIYSCELSINSKLRPEDYVDSDSDTSYGGEAGQFAVSDGKGGLAWVTVETASEVTF